MSKLNIENIKAPVVIKNSLRSLSNNIDFSREDIKACNGHIYFGVNKITGADVAVKFYYWGGKAEFHAEPQQLASINSANVLQIYDAAFIDNSYAYFISPNCKKGDLDEVIATTCFANHAALDLVGQILSGLSHLHEKRFLHRDLKPSNIYLSEDGAAIIGDFGSVKKIPDGYIEIPASSHTLIYRPPESINDNVYGITGDIYQVGFILFQLLGGYLSYDGREWLSKKELAQYDLMRNESDKSIYIDNCIKNKIIAGKVLDMSSLPCWVPSSVKRLLKKACDINPSKRFSTASAFMVKAHELRSKILNWGIVDGELILDANPSYRILKLNGNNVVQKKSGLNWRSDNSFFDMSTDGLVRAISEKFNS